MDVVNQILAFITMAVASGTPILYGTLGEIVNEKVGHLNLGVQGMMAIGGCAGFMVGYASDSMLLAFLAAFVGGMLASLIYAVLTVTFMANQNVTGLTLTICGVGVANFVGKYVLSASGKGTLKLPEGVYSRMIATPTFLQDIPVVGRLFFSYNIFIYLAVAIAIGLTIYLRHTKSGRNLRAIGENPAAADAAGIRVMRQKYFNLLLGGGICGFGGLYIYAIIGNGVWGDNLGELGWIAVALVIFATWHPGKAVIGAYVFGALRILRYNVPASLPIPTGLYDMLPFLMTAIILVITSARKSRESTQPAGCGINYYREER